MQDILGQDVIGAYLFGSAVLGGLKLGSDIDVIAISKRPTTYEQKARFVRRLLDISGGGTDIERWRQVELTVVVYSDIKGICAVQGFLEAGLVKHSPLRR